jgi:glycosyltransferase involved in cell wall biosynthesis
MVQKIKSSKSIFSLFANLFHKENPLVSLIIPAFNEEKSIENVIRQAKKVKEIGEIIVVNDGSKDNTSIKARQQDVIVINHHKNLGKGEAIKTGINHSTGEILLFLDADLENINPCKIKSLIYPIIKDKADFVKASFNLERGRVTEFAVKPMMRVLYPGVDFKQPISGQFAGKKAFFREISIEPKWGIDIGILLDAISKKQRIIEVDIGELIHKGRTTEEKAEMSRQVMETMLRKAGFIRDKHKLIIFSDNVLFSGKNLKQNIELILNKLRIKQHNVALITSKKIDVKYFPLFNIIKQINPNESPENILDIAKKICHKYSVSLNETAVVANKMEFSLLAQHAPISFCFENSPIVLKKSSNNSIQNVSDLLLFLE